MVKRRIKADCRADTRGGHWAGIPVCVIDSAAYKDCSVHAKAALVELVARMNGYNNGKIAVSQRQLTEALRCSPRKIVRCIAELMEHGLIDVHAEGKWKERMAREYRITFVTTKNGSATNEYLRWKPAEKSGATASVSKGGEFGSGAIADFRNPDTAVVTALSPAGRKTTNSENWPASDAASLISKPYVDTLSWWTVDRHVEANRAILALFLAEPLRAAA